MLKMIIATFMIFSSSIIYAQSVGDVIQVSADGVNARKSAYFAGQRNIAFKLAEGDVAEILIVNTLASGNQAFKVRVLKGYNKGREGWIYYNKKSPDIEIFLAEIPDKNPETQEEVVREEEQVLVKNELPASETEEAIVEYDKHLTESFKEYEQDKDQDANNQTGSGDSGETLNRIIGDANNFTPPQVAPQTPVCSDCQDVQLEYPINKIAFAECPANKFNKSLDVALDQSIKDMGRMQHDSEFETVLRCVKGGMENSKGNYITHWFCPSASAPSKSATRSRKPLCLSKGLVGSVSAEIYVTAKCLDQDYRDILPIFNHESRFFPTVRSFSGAGGVGQLTRPAIDTINKNFTKKRDEFAKKPGCEHLANIPMMKSNVLCARTFIPPNPRQNIYYSILFQKLMRDDLKSGPYTQVARLNKMRKIPFNESESKQVAEMLLRTGYNSGPGTINASFRSYVKSSIRRNQNINQFLNGFYKHLKVNVREEAATYNPRILDDVKIMENNAGTKCTF